MCTIQTFKTPLNIKYVLGISLVSALGGFLFGYDWVVIGGAKFFYERYFQIAGIPEMQGLAMSGALIGCIPGAMFAGWISGRYGRKKSLSAAAVLFVISAIGTGLSHDFVWFMLWRICGGIGIGIASCIAPVYIAEVSPRQLRGRFVSLNQLNIVVGILIAQLTNYLIAREVPPGVSDEFILGSWNGQMGWRWMFWAETLPAALFFLLSLFIPESPRWLVKSGNPDQAADILRRTGGQEYAVQLLDEIRSSLKDVAGRVNYRALLDKKIRPVLVTGLVLAAFQQWCGINIVFNYADEVFTSAGFGISNSLFNIVITGIVNLVFTFVAIRMVEGLGRRKLMLFGSAGLFSTYLILGAAYRFHWTGYSVLGIILLAIAVYAMSLAPITWVVLSEIFPNRIRGAAMSLATTVLWIASSLLVLLFPIIKDRFDVSGAFWLYALICILGFLFIRRRLPETKGKSLEEIERMLESGEHN